MLARRPGSETGMPTITVNADCGINGVITTEQRGSVAFCDVRQFASAGGNLIESMKSYTVEIKTEN